VERYYLSVTCFMNAKLGDAVSRHGVSLYGFESEQEALAGLRQGDQPSG
jgi:hypothetical protein